MNRRVLIRVDGSPLMGEGHLMRCLALGQLLADADYNVHVATRTQNAAILSALRQEDFQLETLAPHSPFDAPEDARWLLSLAARIQPDWIVLDGYHFDSEYELRIQKSGYKLLRIDDVPSRHYHADILLNPNYGAETMRYSVDPGTRILAGLRYVLLRREFRKLNPLDAAPSQAGVFNLLISLGGTVAKTPALNLKIAEGLSRITGKTLSATLLTSAAKGETAELKYIAQKTSWPFLIKERSLNMAEELSKTDLAIVSVGSIIWELTYMRVPFLALSLNDRQRHYSPLLVTEGICRSLGGDEDLTPELVQKTTFELVHDAAARKRMQEKETRLIDRNRVGLDLLAILDKGYPVA